MKTQKGITLIALIITIIVMLILVGVSVSVALNTGLFKTAQGVAKNTEAERLNETKLSEGKVTVGTQKYPTLNEYVDSLRTGVIYLSEEPTHILNFNGKVYKFNEETSTLQDLLDHSDDLSYDEDEKKLYLDGAFLSHSVGEGIHPSPTPGDNLTDKIINYKDGYFFGKFIDGILTKVAIIEISEIE